MLDDRVARAHFTAWRCSFVDRGERELFRAFAEALAKGLHVAYVQPLDERQRHECEYDDDAEQDRGRAGGCEKRDGGKREGASEHRSGAVESDVDEGLRRTLPLFRERRVEKLVRGAEEGVSLHGFAAS